MNGVVRSVRMALLVGTVLSVPSMVGDALSTRGLAAGNAHAAESDVGTMSLDEMPPLPPFPQEESEGAAKVFSFDEVPLPDRGPSVLDDRPIPSLPQDTADMQEVPSFPLPPSLDGENGIADEVLTGIPSAPALPGELATDEQRAAQQAQDALGDPILPEDSTEIFDIFSQPEPVITTPVVEQKKEEKPAPPPPPKKAASTPVKKAAEPVVRLPKEYRLPSKIYKKEYSTDNFHLPIAQYEHEYDEQMFLAVAHDRTETVRGLLNTGRSIEMRNARGDTPLLYAVRNRAQNTVRMLLGQGANPNAAGERGVTALHYAMLADSPQMTAALLEMGADPNLPDMGGVTPLMLAASKADPVYTQALVRSGAMANLSSFDGRSPLHVAAETNNARAAALLIQAGADINAAKLRGHTPLMSAAAAGSGDVITVLLNAGADLRATDHLGRTAVDLARAHRHEALANRLMTATIQREQMMSRAAPALRPIGQ